MPARRRYGQELFPWNARTKEESPDPRFAIWRFPLREQPFTVTQPLGYKGDLHCRFVTIGFMNTYEEAVALVQKRSDGAERVAQVFPSA